LYIYLYTFTINYARNVNFDTTLYIIHFNLLYTFTVHFYCKLTVHFPVCLQGSRYVFIVYFTTYRCTVHFNVHSHCALSLYIFTIHIECLFRIEISIQKVVGWSLFSPLIVHCCTVSLYRQCHCTVSLYSVIAPCHFTVSLYILIVQSHCTVLRYNETIQWECTTRLYNETIQWDYAMRVYTVHCTVYTLIVYYTLYSLISLCIITYPLKTI